MQIVQAWAAGVKACCLFSFTGLVLLPAQHIICGNVSIFLYRQIGQQSCRIVANSGIFPLCWEFINTIRAREEMRESERKKRNRTKSNTKKNVEKSYKKLHKKRISLHDMRGRETSRKFEQKRNYVTR